MSLKTLDLKLNLLSKSLSGELTKDSSKGMLVPSGYEERSIRWRKDDLEFLIQIYPEIKNENIQKWVLWTCCSHDTEKSRLWKKAILKSTRNKIDIIADFDNLIKQAFDFLNGLTKDDLKEK